MKQMQKRPLLFQSTRPTFGNAHSVSIASPPCGAILRLEHPAPINAVNERDDKASGGKTADHHLDRYRFPFFHSALMPNESCSSTVQLKRGYTTRMGPENSKRRSVSCSWLRASIIPNRSYELISNHAQWNVKLHGMLALQLMAIAHHLWSVQ